MQTVDRPIASRDRQRGKTRTWSSEQVRASESTLPERTSVLTRRHVCPHAHTVRRLERRLVGAADSGRSRRVSVGPAYHARGELAGEAHWGATGMWAFLYFPLDFSVHLKFLLKLKSIES